MRLIHIKQFIRQVFCKTKLGLWFIIAIGIAVAVSVGQASRADTLRDNEIAGMERIEGIAVEVKGTGPAIIFIPGLNSASATFTETCAAFVQTHSCHLLHLPGFADLPPTQAAQTNFLLTIRDAIHTYIETAQLEKPVLVGHSLGGVLSLTIALEYPDLARQLVIIDALPFYPALQNPALTANAARPQAEQIRSYMQNLPEEEYRRNAAMHLVGMSNEPARMPLLTEWSKTSDRITTAQAMYDMMTTDLRSELNKIKTPTLVLGSWAAYKVQGATQDSTKAIFASQYAQLNDVKIRMSSSGFHFLTWDDPQWVNQEITRFITADTTPK